MISQVFICYAHSDNESDKPNERWLERLLQHLQPLVDRDLISCWSDKELEIGSNWDNEIQQLLPNVKIAVLLVSPAFLASKYIRNKELPVLLKNFKDRGMIILPLIIRRCLFKEVKFKYPDPITGPEELSLSIFQTANSPSKPLNGLSADEQDKIFVEIAKQILKVAESNPVIPPLPSNPKQSVSKSETDATVLNRGEAFNHLVDAVLYVDSAAGQEREEILDALHQGRSIPNKFLYLTGGGIRWLNLIKDPEYVYYTKSIRFFVKNSKEIASIVWNYIKDSSFDFISLGPGDGWKDKLLFRRFMELPGRDLLYYYPYDISPSIIAAVIANWEITERSSILIKAVIADFQRLPILLPVFDFRCVPNVFSLLGNTLGNVPNEGAMLRQLQNVMKPEDLLLLEVKINSNKQVISEFDEDKRFDFGPLEMLGVKFEPSKLEYKYHTAGWSQIPGAKTRTAHYSDFWVNGEHYGKATLSYIHEYDPEQLISFITTLLDFEVVNSLTEDTILFLVLRKM
jgi:hypothetical protein